MVATYAESLALLVRGRRLGRSVLLGRSRRHVEELLPPLDGCRLPAVVVGVSVAGVMTGRRAMAQVCVRRHIAVGGFGACRGSLRLLQVVQLEVVFKLGERNDLAALLDGAFGVLYTLCTTCRLGLNWALGAIFLHQERGCALGVLVFDVLAGICQRAPATPTITTETRTGGGMGGMGGIEVSPGGSHIRPWSRSRRQKGRRKRQTWRCKLGLAKCSGGDPGVLACRKRRPGVGLPVTWSVAASVPTALAFRPRAATRT